MVKQKTKAQIFMEEQLKNKEVAKSFKEGIDELRLAVKIAQKKIHLWILKKYITRIR